MKIRIDGKEVEGVKGESILKIALRNGIKIPAVCYHSDLEPQSNCRLCLVSIKGREGVHTSCSVEAEEGMEITTNSEEIRKLREINLELLFSQHIEQCGSCNWKYKCKLLSLAKEYKIKITRFEDRKKNFPVHHFGPISFDTSKCIDCKNCVQMCKNQGVCFLTNEIKNDFSQVGFSKRDCVYCGQCITHCPSGALEEIESISDVEKCLKDKDKYVVFQFAPAIRSAIGEEFGMNYGEILTDKIVSGIKKLGAKKVFDVSVAADITTIEEGSELIERLKSGENLPMFTSCCPSWVRYVEVYYPQFIKNLTSVRSPHIILGGLTKTYFAEKEKVDPKKIIVVSIMPCVSKKYEIGRKELEVEGLKPVDYVLTTREIAKMFKKNNIDLNKINSENLDSPWDNYTGAGVIYGSTGGVMESALRTVYEKLTGSRLKDINLKEVRGDDGFKEAEINIEGRIVKVAIINGLGNAKKMLEGDFKKYDYVEVMSCPGGCVGGGGQPIPVDREIRKKRADSLYEIDSSKEIRLAHESPVVKLIYKDFLKDKKIIHNICHTKYEPNNRN